ncbi:MAG: uracil-DNA glycosylase [Nitrosomonadaceae bacterium]|nr:uracil-DNA glycosylase [Nitrosomonadaceae bacterium]
MSTRRREILNECGLMPLWRTKVNDQNTSTITSFSIPHINTENDRRSQILCMDWLQLRKSIIDCDACSLCHNRVRILSGVGDENADWLYVSEEPNLEEWVLTESYIDSSDRLLDNMLAAINLTRDRNVYITNIVKCRPLGNRIIESNEAHQCEPYLVRQIELVKPKLIVVLGQVAAQNILMTSANFKSLRGKLHEYAGIPLIVTYHPAYLLHTLADKEKAWEDLYFAKSTMETLS